MAATQVTQTNFQVRRVIRDLKGQEGSHETFAARLEAVLNDFAEQDYDIVQIGIGAFDAIVVASAQVIRLED